MSIEDYTQINTPYTVYLDRDLSGDPVNNGSVMNQPVKDGGDMGDIWTKTFIRSNNWSPKKTGFYIDGQTGYAEFTNVYVSGNIQALTGTIGGFTIGASTISATNLVLTSGVAEVANISVGSGSNVAGINSASSGTAIAFWAGAPFISRDDGAFTVKANGAVTASNFTATGGTITGLTIQTSATGKRLVMAGSPSNQYQFRDGATSVGYLKIDDDGAGGYYAQIFIDHLGPVVEVGSTIGASEVTYFNAPFISTNGRAATGFVQMYGGPSGAQNFGLIWSGSSDAIFTIEADTVPESTNTYDIGSASLAFDNTYARSVRATSSVYSDGLNAYSAAYITFNDPLILRSLLSDPSGVNGMMYYDATNNRVRAYVNSAWKTVTVA